MSTVAATRLSWRRVFAALGVVSLALFALAATRGEADTGSLSSVVFGWSAAALLVALGLFGARRRFLRLSTRWRFGSAASWLRFHLYGGIFFAVLVLLHSSFRRPYGVLTVALAFLSAWVVFSGFVGWFLQRWIPRTLSSGLSREVLWQRIPELVEELRSRAEAVAEDCDETLSFLYRRRVEPALRRPQTRLVFWFDITGGHHSLRDFEYLRAAVDEEERQRLDALEDCYRTKLELDAHYTLQAALRYWLWAHTPASIALAALAAGHVATAVMY